jgi:hypothetical protein
MRGTPGGDGLVYDLFTTISHLQALSSLLRRIFTPVERSNRARDKVL